MTKWTAPNVPFGPFGVNESSSMMPRVSRVSAGTCRQKNPPPISFFGYTQIPGLSTFSLSKCKLVAAFLGKTIRPIWRRNIKSEDWCLAISHRSWVCLSSVSKLNGWTVWWTPYPIHPAWSWTLNRMISNPGRLDYKKLSQKGSKSPHHNRLRDHNSLSALAFHRP